jgi:hypothetical protein
MFESTDITPIPPNESIGTIWSSFPEYIFKSSLQRFAISAICEMFPLASFIATMFSIFDNSLQVSGKIFTPVLLATLYNIIGSFVLFAIAV